MILKFELEPTPNSRVQPPKQSDTGTRLLLVTLKPNHLPNRADLSRYLDGFDVLSARSVAGRVCIMKMIIKTVGNAPLLRHSSGEYHDGGAGTSL
jgi:hypothetical protein